MKIRAQPSDWFRLGRLTASISRESIAKNRKGLETIRRSWKIPEDIPARVKRMMA